MTPPTTWADPPAPTAPATVASPPGTRLAQEYAILLAPALGVDAVDPDDRYFDDLGADSMVMARFCAAVRKRGDLPTPSMRDVYRAGTLALLAARADAPADAVPAQGAAGATGSPGSVTAGSVTAGSVTAGSVTAGSVTAGSVTAGSVTAGSVTAGSVTVGRETVGRSTAGIPAPAAVGSAPTPTRAVSSLGRLTCASAQVTWLLAYGTLNLFLVVRCFEWVTLAHGLAELYVRALSVGVGLFAVWTVLPVLLKWLLVGRWRQADFRIYGLRYLRFWIVGTAIRANPFVVAFAGSPLLVLYLRALGARIGPGVVILTRHLPVCTDLVTIGAGTLVRGDARLAGYRARAGRIETGPVRLGAEVFVGEFAVLDIDTAMGDGAQLGHSSSLAAGQVVPPGQSWHGTPAQPSPSTYRLTRDDGTPATRGATILTTLRRIGYSLVQVALLVAIGLPASFGVVEGLLSTSRLEPLLHPELLLVADPLIYAEVAAVVAVAFYAAVGLGIALAATVPRLLARALVVGRVYPLYGWHYGLHRMIVRLTNVPGLTTLFGDASAITTYLSALGYRLRPMEQTGSNFGQAVRHEHPQLCTVGAGTMVADGLALLNADLDARSFRLGPAAIGAHSFLGNHVVVPTGARIGDNVLLATKVAVPLHGPVRQDVGLLGSPAFEIPRTVRRDTDLGLGTRVELRAALRAKNRHNHVTMALYLALRCLFLYVVVVLGGLTFDLYLVHGPAMLLLWLATTLVLPVLYWVLVERLYARLQLLAPRGCSIYDRAFWGHERYWKGPSVAVLRVFDGTPLKGTLWRLMGVRVGRGLYDDGAAISERGFVTLGDDCILNAGAVLQGHSQEDGAFKSDRIRLGDRCSVGTGALVHYGVTLGDDVEIGPDAFVMKGEEVPPGGRWVGNPARPATDAALPAAAPGRPHRDRSAD